MSKKISLNKVLALGATSTALFSGAMMMNNNKVEASSSSIVLLKFKHNAYRYNKNGKRIGTGYITKGSTYYSRVLTESTARNITSLIQKATSTLKMVTYQLAV